MMSDLNRIAFATEPTEKLIDQAMSAILTVPTEPAFEILMIVVPFRASRVNAILMPTVRRERHPITGLWRVVQCAELRLAD